MIARPPTVISGFGVSLVSRPSRDPGPPAMTTATLGSRSVPTTSESVCSRTIRDSASTSGTAEIRSARIRSSTRARGEPWRTTCGFVVACGRAGSSTPAPASRARRTSPSVTTPTTRPASSTSTLIDDACRSMTCMTSRSDAVSRAQACSRSRRGHRRLRGVDEGLGERRRRCGADHLDDARRGVAVAVGVDDLRRTGDRCDSRQGDVEGRRHGRLALGGVDDVVAAQPAALPVADVDDRDAERSRPR